MRHGRDVTIFVGSVLAYSLLLSAVTPDRLANSLFAVTVTSVIFAARGCSWKRKLVYAGAAFGGVVLFDRAFFLLGLDARLYAFGAELAATTFGLLYLVFTVAYPLAVLLLFVGRDPSVLWVKPAKAGEQEDRESG